MSFFEGRPARKPRAAPAIQRPEWAGPQAGVVPGCSSQTGVVFSSDSSALGVHSFEVYPNGITFKATLWLREPTYLDHRYPDDPLGTHRHHDEDAVRFGLQFEDGSSWTNLDPFIGWQPNTPPPPPFVSEHGGGGGGDKWSHRYWIWPVPDGDTIRFIGAWPKYDIAESSVTVDLNEIRSQLDAAVTIWG